MNAPALKNAETQKGWYKLIISLSSKPTVYTQVVEKRLLPNRYNLLRAQKRSPHDQGVSQRAIAFVSNAHVDGPVYLSHGFGKSTFP